MEERLPIADLLPDIQKQLQERNTLIVHAPPGAGKSTWLPAQLLQEPWLKDKKILLVQPRRLAVKSVASRLAWHMSEPVGQTIGYRIRFDSRTSNQTRIEVITEGILTRMLLSDNALEEIGMILMDEFHERSLELDTAFVLVRECQKILRHDLRLVVMSATLPGEKIARCMEKCPVLTSSGRAFPVEILYLETPPGDTKLTALTVRAVLKSLRQDLGDILVFLPGKAEILQVAEALSASDGLETIKLVPLYGDQELNIQEEALLPDTSGRRKIVLSTPVAETSLTIEGITVVIDSGFAKVPAYDPASGLSRLERRRISRESADQRAGRAGRLGPGKAYRLWTRGEHGFLPESRKPEILDADLSSLVLELSDWGLKDPSAGDWPDLPPAGALAQAVTWLQSINALQEGNLTEYGKQLLNLPAHPRIAALLLSACTPHLIPLASTLAALLEEKDPCPETGADIETKMEVFRKWKQKEPVQARIPVLQRMDQLSRHWKQLLRSSEVFKAEEVSACGVLLAAAYPERIARQTEKGSNRYRLANGRIGKLETHDDLIRYEWIVIASMDAGKQEGKIFLAAPLDLAEVKTKFQSREKIEWDSRKKELQCHNEIHLMGLPVEVKPLLRPDPKTVLKVLSRAIQDSKGDLLDWNESVHNWLARLQSLRLWRPEEEWPSFQKEDLINTVEEWLQPWLENIRNAQGLKNLDLLNILKSRLDWHFQQKLEVLAPVSIQVPTGSNIRLEYFEDGSPPVLAVRLQEMFGLAETPRINEGRMPVLLHLLSPGYKPVQVTRDLRSFWNNTYFEVRKDLKGRYPKHAWPDDPWNADPVRKGRSERK
jgi:ATP-dependent helicase HrpB